MVGKNQAQTWLNEVITDRLMMKFKLGYVPQISSITRLANGWSAIVEDSIFIIFDDGEIEEIA
jgi:hypothetical protein